MRLLGLEADSFLRTVLQIFRFGKGRIFGNCVGQAGKIHSKRRGYRYRIPEEDLPFWKNYFDLELDYDTLLKEFNKDKTLKAACKGRKIRVLKQPPFETLISFIISQNNNIKRITGIIDRLCEGFGKKTDFGYAFPTRQDLKGVTAEDLAPLRAGFRAKYIADAVEKVNGGEVDFEKIKALPDDEAREALKVIKVADCVLLFGLHRLSAVPKDVWIKRINAYYYPDGYPDCIKGYEGIAQQYLFDFARTDFKAEQSKINDREAPRKQTVKMPENNDKKETKK